MEELKQQVETARRRLVVQQFLSYLPWCLFATLGIAVVGLAAPKLFAMDVDSTVWTWSWLGGALFVGILTAGGWTAWKRRTALDAAWEIDHRFGLKQRVSSVMALDPSELESPAGKALMHDAVRRASAVDVREQFTVGFSRRAWLPLVPAVVAFCLVLFVQDRGLENPAEAANADQVAQQVKKSAEVLRRKILAKRKQAEKEGAKDAEGLFKKLEQATRELERDKAVDRKKAMVKLNDLAKQLEARKRSLGGGDRLKEQLNRLKSPPPGPADKLAKAMKQGDFKQALDEIKKLQDQVKQGDLSDEKKQALGKQLDALQDKIGQMADAHQQAKNDLQQQIEQQKAAGNLDAAAKLQQQLDKLNQQQPQMDALKDLAQKLGQAAEAAKQGDAQQMAQALDQLAQDFDKLAQDAGQMEMLEEVMDQIAQAKDAMGCKQCAGAGCKACGGGMKAGQGGGQGKGGDGLGAAQGGFGQRPEEEDQTNTRDSHVRQNIGRGKAVITDLVDGPNIKGQVRQSIKTEIDAARSAEADPLTGQRLPKDIREHAREYFDAFREGE